MPGLIGKKVGMTSVFSAEGKSIPCTVIEAGPCVVTQVKTIEKDGYTAIQLGFDDKKEKNTTTTHYKIYFLLLHMVLNIHYIILAFYLFFF